MNEYKPNFKQELEKPWYEVFEIKKFYYNWQLKQTVPTESCQRLIQYVDW